MHLNNGSQAEWDREEQEVHRENTAQAIHQALEEIENLREEFAKRWIWELFQNALDAARIDKPIQIHIEHGTTFIFRHDGDPFTRKEVLHLIFHGSTKKEKDDSIGRYGTGFLTTHLVSRSVRIQGILDTGYEFNFVLDRRGNTPEELQERMNDSRAQLFESLKPSIAMERQWTILEYLNTHESKEIIEKSISGLSAMVPFVLAFNNKLKGVEVTTGDKVSFHVAGKEPLFENGYLVEVKRVGDDYDSQYIAVVDGEDVSIAVRLIRDRDQYRVTFDECVPKFFVAFPLFGTEGLPMPFVLNCPAGKPTDQRDGLFLGSESSPDNIQNKAYVKRAWELFGLLVNHAVENDWKDLFNLAVVGGSPPVRWLDEVWLKDLHAKKLLDVILPASLLINDEGNRVAPNSAVFPTTDREEEFQRLQESVRDLYGSSVPNHTEAPSWARALKMWVTLGDLADLGIKTISISKLAEKISTHESMEGLQRALSAIGSADLDAMDWLNRTNSLFLSAEGRALLDTHNILPDQTGAFRSRGSLSKDDGIDGTLKDIATLLGKDFRERLLDSRVIPEIQDLLPSYGQEELLDFLLSHIKSESIEGYGSSDYLQANTRLFAWLLSNERLPELKSYPVFSRSKDSAGNEVIAPTDSDLLGPVEVWPLEAQRFVSLFPGEYILSSIYATSIDASQWKWLADNGVLLCDPVVHRQQRLEGEDLAKLLETPFEEGQEDEHVMESVDVVDLVCMQTRDGGILGSIRKSKLRCTLFLQFVVNYVLPRTGDYLKYESVQCSCGKSHRLHRAMWVAPLQSRQWVYEGKNRSETPTASNLAQLWKGEAGFLECLSDNAVALFLIRLRASPSEIMRYASCNTEEELREIEKGIIALQTATKNNPEQLKVLAEIVANDRQLFDDYKSRKEKRERGRRNKILGSIVEKLFRELFENTSFRELGLSIQRTGLGSDFAIEHDLTDGEQEFGFQFMGTERQFLIELKSTFKQSVAMTKRQAEESVKQKAEFALCVVSLEDREISLESVRRNARFVVNIGDQIEGKAQMVQRLEQLREETTTQSDVVTVLIDQGQIRYKIMDQVWASALGFEEFREFLKDFFGVRHDLP